MTTALREDVKDWIRAQKLNTLSARVIAQHRAVSYGTARTVIKELVASGEAQWSHVAHCYVMTQPGQRKESA